VPIACNFETFIKTCNSKACPPKVVNLCSGTKDFISLKFLITIFANFKFANSFITTRFAYRKNIIILDTETSGFYNDILQLAYVICNDKGTIIKSVNKFVKDRIPSIDSTKIHGITKEKIKKEGIDFHEIIKELSKDLDSCEIIVGHNVQFDLNTIKNDIRTYGIHIVDNKGNNKINIFDSVKIIDTLTLAKKKIKLEQLYFELFNKKFSGAHDALNDVLATKDCYFKLIFNK
jgi:DNA polymerase III epsilon subunit-like protein